MPIPSRETFVGAECLLPELGMLGRNHQLRARVPGLLEHTHDHAFEIFWIERGEVEWWTGNENHHVTAGQIYINRPGERHGSSGLALQPCAYYWLQLKAQARFLPALSAAESKRIWAALQGGEHRCFTVSPQIASHFQALMEEARCPTPLSRSVARAHLHLLLACIVRESVYVAARRHSAPIQIALDLIAANLENEISGAELALKSGLSAGHFRERFRSEMGFTLHAYITRQRVEASKTLLLSQQHSVTAIAQRFGFSSGQHFATVFKKLEGVSPSDYSRKSMETFDGC